MDIIAVFVSLLFFAFICQVELKMSRNFPVPAGDTKRDWFKSAQDELKAALHLHHNTNIAKNVIVFLGDGMGFTNIWASRIYAGQYKHNQSGEEFQFNFEKFPHVGVSKTYNVDYQIPDSAGTATAFLCGIKANAWTVGVNENVHRSNCSNQAENSVDSILQWSMDEGKATGIVTTTRVTHATPSAAYAHSAERFWENDYEMTRSRMRIDPQYNLDFGCKDIARQLVEDNPGINVVLGGGRRNFRDKSVTDEEYNTKYRRLDGRDLIQEWIDEKEARDASHAYVWNKAALDEVDLTKTEYLLGLFEPSHQPYEAERNPQTDPSLAEMTSKAIQLLSNNKNGFFLLVEGGKIDHAHHSGKARLALDETWGMDEAVRVALEMTNQEETLIVVTADHSHSMATAGYTSRGNDILGFADNTHLSQAQDHLPYTTLMYSTGPGAELNQSRKDLTNVDIHELHYRQQALVKMSQETHGGEDVPIYAVGPMAHLFHGVHEQHYIAHVMAHASCVGHNKKHCRQRAYKHKYDRKAAMVAGTADCNHVTSLTLYVVVTLGYLWHKIV